MPLDQLPWWAQLGVGAIFLGALLIGAGTKRFGRLWVFGWVYDGEVAQHKADVAAAEARADEWKQLYFEAAGIAADTVEAAKGHTTLTPEESDQVRRLLTAQAADHGQRVVRNAGRERRG